MARLPPLQAAHPDLNLPLLLFFLNRKNIIVLFVAHAGAGAINWKQVKPGGAPHPRYLCRTRAGTLLRRFGTCSRPSFLVPKNSSVTPHTGRYPAPTPYPPSYPGLTTLTQLGGFVGIVSDTGCLVCPSISVCLLSHLGKCEEGCGKMSSLHPKHQNKDKRHASNRRAE